ncbi:DUF1127 domain-containing protein [Acidocella sp.]|jgi:uncharacterized protein YjiS (DUF1127 family)|uniref:DUF1127 domain-containing protein n=1 Tax=Acidocella sp. TaxID=50710 RepID=UPI002619B5D1|nr:DUF1127 domain-containing protein [Acidocella sp.]
MTTATFNHGAFAKFGALFFAHQAARTGAPRHYGLLNAFRRWRERRSAMAELASLSDRELADIGLTRDDLPALYKTL